MLPRESKQLLANIIRHTDTHNRILEEEECWKQRSLQLRKRTRKPSYSLAPQLESRPEQHYGYEDDIRMNSRAHMDCESDVRHCSYEGREEKTSTFWLRQYDRAEMEDAERWGHNGYKELYPQDFVSDSDDDDRGNKNVDGFIRSKRCHSPDVELKKKHKSNRQEKKGRKSKKHHRHKNNTLDDSKPHKSKKHKSSKFRSHKGKKKHKKHKD